MGLVILFLIGTFIGGLMATLICIRRYRPRILGRIHFYDAEPGEDPIMVAELYESTVGIRNRERVTFEVSHK